MFIKFRNEWYSYRNTEAGLLSSKIYEYYY